jgi:ketosteroid isomerase-like protein
MSQADVDVVDRFLKAFQAGDIETAFSLLHPEVVIHEGDGLPYAGQFVGHAGLQNLLGKMFEHLEMRLGGYEIIGAGPSAVAVKLAMVFTSRKSGREMPMPGIELYETKDGLVSKIDVYYKDTTSVANLVEG